MLKIFEAKASGNYFIVLAGNAVYNMTKAPEVEETSVTIKKLFDL